MEEGQEPVTVEETITLFKQIKTLYDTVNKARQETPPPSATEPDAFTSTVTGLEVEPLSASTPATEPVVFEEVKKTEELPLTDS